MALLETFVLFLIAGYLLFKWSTAKYDILRERSIPHERPKPFLGNIGLKVFTGKDSFIRNHLDRYNRFKGHKVYGFYRLRDPLIVIRDPELIKKIGVRDFDSFSNHKSVLTAEDDNILRKSLMILEDQQWKEMRQTLSASFTGKKMRIMYELINEISLHATKYIEEEVKATGKGEVELEMKEFFTRFTNDAIASTAFGFRVNSFKDKMNQFYIIGRSITQFRGFVLMKAFLFTVIPNIMRILKMKLMDQEKLNYLSSLIYDAMKYRREHKIVRPDMIHLLMEAQQNRAKENSEQPNGHSATFNDDDILAQSILFFFAGFETVSSCLCMTTFELLKNPDVQLRLYEEIIEVEEQLEGKPIDFDTLNHMKYLDMVMSEGLRKWPPASMVDRRCGADYKLTDEKDNLIMEIKKDDICILPIIGLQHDPDHWEDPEKFDPERFSDENKHKIKPNTYIPFGVGPRACIGNRLALMETKSIIYSILRKFEIVAAEKTPHDLMSALSGFSMEPKELYWMKLVPRKS